MTNTIEDTRKPPAASAPASAAELDAIKTPQRATWASGDFGIIGTTLQIVALLEDGRRRAEAERLTIRFQEADAEALPFPDGAFDVVLSSFGVMFAPNHVRAAGEMLRVCRPNGP
jgi:SAM-dependent methyltransferase